jgi:hypothetical protein
MSPEAGAHLQDLLNAQTGCLSWEELVPHFARGVVIRVNPGVDLLETAEKIVQDDKAEIEQMYMHGDLRRALDSDAHSWNENESTFWSVVVAPWVLVQEIQSN